MLGKLTKFGLAAVVAGTRKSGAAFAQGRQPGKNRLGAMVGC